MIDRLRSGMVVAFALLAFGLEVGSDRPAIADDWPEKGPIREGSTLVFPHHNLRWTLPEGSPWKWSQPTHDESKGTGELVRCGASSKQDFLWCRLSVQREKAWANIKRALHDPRWLGRANPGLLEDVDSERTVVKESVPFGNHEACLVRMVGTQQGDPAVLRYYETYLHGEIYMLHLIVGGRDDSETRCKEYVDGLPGGIEFVDIAPWVVGPCWVGGTMSTDRPMGHGLGEAREIELDGCKATKPPSMTTVPVNVELAGPNHRFAWEAWSEDKLAYIYFDLSTTTMRVARQKRDFEESLIATRAEDWKKNVADAKVLTRGKKLQFKEKWGRSRGVGYEFHGSLNGQPFVELGYLFKHKKHHYWVKLQYGGVDAQERMADLYAVLRKSLKF